MKRPGEKTRLSIAATTVHDIAVLVAVFYAPILWGQVNTVATNSSGQAFTAVVISIAVLAAVAARWASSRYLGVIPNAIHLPAVVFLGLSAISSIFSVSHHASKLELTRLAIGVLLFWLLANRAALPVTKANLVAALFACTVLINFGLPGEGEAGLAQKILTAIAIGTICALIASNAYKSSTQPTGKPDAVRWTMGALILSTAFVVAVFGLREKFYASRILGNQTWSIFSTFFNPNPLGGFLAMMFPLALAATLVATVLWQRLVWGFAGILLIVTIFPTHSKGAWVALAVAMGLFLLLSAWASSHRKRNFSLVIGLFLLVILAAGIVAWRSPNFRTQVVDQFSEQRASNMFRILTWKGTVRMAAAYPVLGIGPGAFKYCYPKYAIAGYVEAAHQNFLQIAAEQGALGLAVFIWLVGAVMFTGVRVIKSSSFEIRMTAVGGISAIIVLLVHSLLDYGWYMGATNLSFWVVAGALAHLSHGNSTFIVTNSSPPSPQINAARTKKRRRETNIASDPMSDVRGIRVLPWPKTPRGRSAVVLGVIMLLFFCASVPTRNALAQDVLSRGTEARMARQGELCLALYEQAIKYDPGWSEAWEMYGLVEGMIKDQEKGVHALKHAIQLEPTFFRPFSSLGQFYAEKGKYREAIETYWQTIERFPNHTATLRRLAETYQRLGNGEMALQVYERMVAVEVSPFNRYRALADIDVDTEFAYAHYQLGRSAFDAFRRKTSRNKLLQAEGEFNWALRIINEYQQRGRQTDEMFRKLNMPKPYRAEDLQKLEAKARWRVAEVYTILGNLERARAERMQAQALWSDTEKAVKIEDGVLEEQYVR